MVALTSTSLCKESGCGGWNRWTIMQDLTLVFGQLFLQQCSRHRWNSGAVQRIKRKNLLMFCLKLAKAPNHVFRV